MNQKRLRGLVLVFILLFVVFWTIISSATNIDAKANITPTLYATNWNYLPYIRGLKQGPTVTATLPPPTMTPWATNTPTATATSTATSTPTPTATNTVAPPNTAPILYDIDNPDQDGNFTVAWSAVAGADFYQLQQNYNNTIWKIIYQGPELSNDMANMVPGDYCYNVRIRTGNQWGDWAGEKCTTVVGEPEPEYMCEFETLYDGPRSMGSDIELLHDGRVFITQTSEDGASIFDPQTRDFKQVNLPQGGGNAAAVMADGKVLLTVEGDDPHSMIYDPVDDEITRLDAIVDCLGVYDIFRFGEHALMTYCDDNHGYVYFDIYEGWVDEYMVDLGGDYQSYVIFEHYDPLGYRYTLVTNGIAGYVVETTGDWVSYVSNVFDIGDIFTPPESATSAISYDKSKIYFIGGFSYDTHNSIKEAYSVDYGTVERIADMWQDRQYPAVIGLPNGNMIVLAGHSGDEYYGILDYLTDIEIYVPSTNKWYKAGSLNIERTYHQAIRLLNGDIFVYGGITEPGPGYAYIAPPEIGRCELKANN